VVSGCDMVLWSVHGAASCCMLQMACVVDDKLLKSYLGLDDVVTCLGCVAILASQTVGWVSSKAHAHCVFFLCLSLLLVGCLIYVKISMPVDRCGVSELSEATGA
jgi:hypothetical protein